MKEVSVLKDSNKLIAVDFENKEVDVIEPTYGAIDYTYIVNEDCIIDGKEVKANSVVLKTFEYGDVKPKFIVLSGDNELIDYIKERNEYYKQQDENTYACCKKHSSR